MCIFKGLLQNMVYYIIAGETSGDLHGANLIKALKKEDPDAIFHIVGGDQMAAAAGVPVLIHTSEMAFMGFIEVIKNLGSIAKNLKKVKEDIARVQPDTVILIDFPGFNLKIAAYAKKLRHHYLLLYFSKIWAWNQKGCIKSKRSWIICFVSCPLRLSFTSNFTIRSIMWAIRSWMPYLHTTLIRALRQTMV